MNKRDRSSFNISNDDKCITSDSTSTKRIRDITSSKALTSDDETISNEFDDTLVKAIFQLGLKTASPKQLLSYMPQSASLTTDHIKSHLQKHRLHEPRSMDEFFAFYREHMKPAMNRAQNMTSTGNSNSSEDDMNYQTLSSNYLLARMPQLNLERNNPFEGTFKEFSYMLQCSLIEHARQQHLVCILHEKSAPERNISMSTSSRVENELGRG